MDLFRAAKISQRSRAELEGLAGYRPHSDAEKVFTLTLKQRWGWHHRRYQKTRGFLKRTFSTSLWRRQAAIYAMRRMRRRPFHSHWCSCFPIHNASCVPFALCLRGSGWPERGRSVFYFLVRSSTDSRLLDKKSFSEFLDEASGLMSCIHSN